ncbi:MAG: hypothetical protein ACI9R3_001669 [Verrucomicrobiales bacterium]|jgi:hypothetical protein
MTWTTSPFLPLWFRGMTVVLASLSSIWLIMASHAGDAAYPVTKATEVVTIWDPTQHVYTKGTVGVGNKQLQELEQWMDQYARNWTAVLLENAEGETFTDAAGKRYSGMDAVDHALGRGLPNQTVFGQFVDDRTGQRNGAFFVLYLKERKFGYYASDAFDSRRLGEKQWQGNLDAPAIAAMRTGGRVVDAVKDTITHLEKKLALAISSERQVRERAVAEAKRDRQRAEASIGEAEQEIVNLENRLTAMRHRQTSSKNVDVDLSKPETARWRGELGIAANSLADDNRQAAHKRVEQVKKAVAEFHRRLDRYIEDGKTLLRLNERLPTLVSHPESVDAPIELQFVRENLAKSTSAHARMDSAYRKDLLEAEAAFEAFEIANARAAQSVRHREERQRTHRRVAGGSSAAGVVALLGLSVAGNRRRRRMKEEGERLCDIWETGLRAKTDGLFTLLDRTAIVIGSSAELEKRGYAGETLQLSKQTIKDVDELFIMATCADEVLERAQKLTRPDGIGAKSINLVAESRYEKALKLLNEDAIQFQPKDGLEHIMRSPRSERESLLGDVKTYEPFAMSFDELIEAFNVRAARALGALDIVENAWATIVPEMESVDALLRAVESKGVEIDDAAAKDGWFPLLPVFEKLLPSARRDHVAAVNLGGTDPVTALQIAGAEASRKASEAQALVHATLQFRAHELEDIHFGKTELSDKDYAIAWICVLLDEFSDNADEIARGAVATSTQSEMEEWETALAEFADRVAAARKSAERLESESTAAIADTEEIITQARTDLAGALELSPDALFCESEDWDPIHYVARSKEALTAAHAALDRGAVSAAEVSLNEVQALTNDARRIVTATTGAHAAHAEKFDQCKKETKRLDGFVSWHSEILERLRTRYASSALRISAIESVHDHEDGEETIESHIDEASAMIAICREWQSLADTDFRAGKILMASEMMGDIEDEHGDIARRFTDIVRQDEALQKAEKVNTAAVGQHEKFADSMRPAMSDPKVSQSTIDTFADTLELDARAKEAVDAAHGVADPFAAGTLLNKLGTALNQVEDLVQTNRDSFAEAERSAASASRQLERNLALVRKADIDKIPDSPATSEAKAATQQLVEDAQRMDAQLKVAHLDWLEVDAEADRIDAEGARWAACLQEELERARQSVEMMQQASAVVRGATGWTGSHGVRISGSPGYDYVESARQFLLVGNYIAAQQAASKARRIAEQAVAAAQARVAQLRREEQERREAKRRRRARLQAEAARRRRARSSSSSSGGFGSRRSSSSSSSGGGFSSSRSSGSRRSSFSSGSGVSRSGW